MSFAKKVLIAVDLNNNQKNLLKPLKKMDFLAECEVNFIHVFPTMSYAIGIGEYSMMYPVESDRKLIEQSTLAALVKMSQEVLPIHFPGKVLQTVLFNDVPKKGFSDYANEQKADTIIITTKRKHSFFESSFADYVNKHTDSTMIFLKHKE